MSEQDRDLRLGAAIAALDVPDHRSGFWDELEQRLMPDRITRHRAAVVTDFESPDADAPAPSPLDLHGARRRRPRRVHRGPFLLAAAAVVVVVAIAAALVTSRSDKPDDHVTTAAEVIAGVGDRLGSLRTLSGSAEIKSYRNDGQLDRRYRFWRDSAGSYRLTGIDHEEDHAYDAATGVETWHLVDPEGNVLNIRDTNLPIGPPDGGAAGPYQLEADVTTALQALRSQPDSQVREGTENGRPVWLLETDVSPDLLGANPVSLRMELAIDRDAMVPVRVAKFAAGVKEEELIFSNLVVDAPPAAGTFTADVPASAQSVDYGFRRVATSADATGALGYLAPEPAFVPDGYSLTSVAWAKDAAPTGAEAMNPPSVDVITLLYTRGFEWFTVSTRRAVSGDEGQVWDDPIAGEGTVQKYRDVPLKAGQFAGVTAHLSLTQPFPPHIWALSPDFVLTVAGNLTADELAQVAESIG